MAYAGELWHHAVMTEYAEYPALSWAERNYKEAMRQYEHAKVDHQKGEISDARLDQLARLRDVAAEELQRVKKEY